MKDFRLYIQPFLNRKMKDMKATNLLNTDELPVHGPGGETAKLQVGGLSTVVEGCGVSENLFFLDPPLLKIVFFPGFLLAFQGFWGIKILLRDAFDFIIFFP